MTERQIRHAVELACNRHARTLDPSFVNVIVHELSKPIAPLWEYSFTVTPSVKNKAMMVLFGLYGKVTVVFCEKEFKAFKDELEQSFLLLREVTRVPYREPEGV